MNESAQPPQPQDGKPLRLGELELAILEHLWAQGDGTAKSIHDGLGRSRGITHNTVQSTLERLFRKGLVERQKRGHSFFYHCRFTRTDLLARRIDDLATELSGGEVNAILAAFVQFTSRLDESRLRELEQMIADSLNTPHEGKQ